MPTIEIPSPEQAAAYARKLQEVVDDFRVLGHGSRLQAALALGLSNSAVSSVLNMRGVDTDILDNLGMWAREQRHARGV